MITNADIEKLKQVFPTKEDLRRYVTKDDLKSELKRFVTKNDLKNELKSFATKDDLKSELKKYATKEDLKNHPTHDWMQNIINQLIKTMAEMFEAQNERLDKRFDEIHNDIVAHQRQLDNHETRILKIEKTRSN